MPKREEWPEVGVSEYGQIANVGELLARPLMQAKAPATNFDAPLKTEPGRSETAQIEKSSRL